MVAGETVIGRPISLAIAIVLLGFAALCLPAVARAVDGPEAAGSLYDVGGYRLYLQCSGAGSPTVILDSGLGGDHTEWSAVQPTVARVTRVCSWDRAGLGKSDHRPQRGPVATEQIVAELHALLHQADIAPPYVLVGHSLGGINMRVYQMRHPTDVMGLVMAEGTPEQQELTGDGIESANGETMSVGSAAHALLRWGLAADFPLVVIERAKDTDSVWQAQQAALSVLSRNSLLIVANNSDHGVEREQPALVVAGIKAVVESLQNHTRLEQCPSSVPSLGGQCLSAGTAPPEGGVNVSVGLLVGAIAATLLVGVGIGLLIGWVAPRFRHQPNRRTESEQAHPTNAP